MNKVFSLMISMLLVVSCSDGNRRVDSAKAHDSRSSEQVIRAEVARLLSELTLEEKISLLHANSKFSVAGVERLGIAEMRMSDGPHGVREEISRDSWASANWTTDFATYLPPLTATAASWDPEVARLHGGVLGAEARHREKDIILGPGVNLARLPTYGRNFEYLGEDPFLAAALVSPIVQAIQDNDVAACVKHYALNTQELERWTVDAKPDERTLREVYLPAFESAVKEGGALSIMGGYNRVDGINANQNKMLVNDILKGEWGFDGVLLTDWHVDINTFDAAMNGLDVEMGTRVPTYGEYYFADALLEEVKQGNIPESVVDEKVRRILGLQLRIGMMDPARKTGERNTEKHHQIARKIIEQGIVLLQNKNQVLPLEKPRLKRVLVLGPNANLAHGRGGGSSQVKSSYEVTPLQGLRNALGEDVEIEYMRAAGDTELKAIASDYISTRHGGSGTPAWQIHFFHDLEHSQYKSHNQWPSSHYRVEGEEKQHINFAATIVPLETGEHLLQLKAAGKVDFLVDGQSVIRFESESDVQRAIPLQLEAGKAYKFLLRYDGSQQFTLGWEAPGLKVASKAEYLAAAKTADAVIYFAGLNHDYDREGQDRSDMTLPGNQDEVIANLLGVNAKTIVFIVAGSAVEMPWAEAAPAIVWGWYGGMEAGNAYARMLLGELNPSGKMPITLPVKYEHTAPIALNDYNEVESRYKEGVFIGYRWFEKQNIQPIFPFGHGLSYTSFEISGLHVRQNVSPEKAVVSVTVMVKNTGDYRGAEVVQLYLGDAEASVERPAKELKGFKKIWLDPGEEKPVILNLSKRDLAFWDIKTKDWLVEPGVFNVFVGASVQDIRQQASFSYQP